MAPYFVWVAWVSQTGLVREDLYMQRSPPHEEEGNEAVLQTLIRKYGAAIVQYCRTRLGEGLAEEVAQEVFVAAWHKLAMAPPRQDALVEWLFGIARNKCRQAYRNRSRRYAIEHAFTAEIRDRAHAQGPVAPGEMEAAAEVCVRLHTCLGHLRAQDRIILILWYWKALPIREIATIMGKSEAAVRKQLTRAQQRLKELMHAPSGE